MDSWKEYGLGDVYSFSSGLSKSRDQFGFGFPFLSFKEVFHNYFIPDDLPLLANTSEKERSKCSILRGDVFLTRTSEKQNELGMSSVALKDYPGATFNGFTKRLRPLGNIDVVPEYAGYYFRSPKFRAMVSSMSSMTTRASLNNDMLKHLKIRLPNINTQKAIAEVLSSLDDKIDLLHRQNKTLEAMAETLFRRWFVEEEFKSTIGDLIDIQNGYAFKSKDFSEVGLNKVIKIKNISGGTVNISSADRISETVAEQVNTKFSITGGDILFAMTGAEIGKMGIVERNSQDLWLNQRVGLFREKYNGSKYLAYLCLKSDFGQDYIENTATGSAQPNISATGISNCPFPSLTEEQIVKYSEILNPQFEKIVSNLGNMKTLTNLRDTLLPKLMSGEVRVRSQRDETIVQKTQTQTQAP